MDDLGHVKMPCDVYLYLQDFMGERASDIELEIENFDLLKPVQAWMLELEKKAGVREANESA